MLDFYGVQEALRDLLKADATLAASVKQDSFFIEMMDREDRLDHMPIINVRLTEGASEIRSIPNGYYVTARFDIDIVSFDFTHFNKAARVRDNLLNRAMAVVKGNADFHVDISTSTVGPDIKFGAGTPDQGGGHLALATFSVTIEADINAS